MSKELRQWASRQNIKSRSAARVLRTIVWMCGASTTVRLSHQTLMRRTGHCRRTIIEAIKLLRSMELIEVQATRNARGRQGANQYTIRPDKKAPTRVQNQPVTRVQNHTLDQSAKNAPLYTEVVIHQGKNEPREPNTVGVSNRGWDGGWPPPHLRLTQWPVCDDDPVIDTDWSCWGGSCDADVGYVPDDDCEVPQ